MLGIEEIRDTLSVRKEALHRQGVRQLWVFGSVSRAEAKPQDIDFLVSFVSPPTLTQFMGLKFYLESVFQLPIDLHSAGSCPDRFYSRIKDELQHVA